MTTTGPASHDSPVPVRQVADEGDSAAFLPYPDLGADLANVPVHVRPEVAYYQARMGFLPNTIKLYLHVPWAAELLIRLNNAVMRDERGALSEHFKYRLALVASRDNECTYCTAHHAATMKARWAYADGDVSGVLRLDSPADDREAAAFTFVHEASLDPTAVRDETRDRLRELFTPQEVMEIVLVTGFWKMYNTMHSAMAAPLEDPVLGFAGWVDVQPTDTEAGR